MDSIAPYLLYAMALGVAAAVPGPGVMALVGRSMTSGLGSSLPFVLGMTVGDVIYLTVATLGLAALASTAEYLLLIIRIAGGSYLLYVAWAFWSAEISSGPSARFRVRGLSRDAFSGLMVTLSNPKAVVFYLALVPSVIELGNIGLLEWAALSLVTVSVLIVVLLPYAVLSARLARALFDPTWRNLLNKAGAAVIGGTAGWILWDAMDP